MGIIEWIKQNKKKAFIYALGLGYLFSPVDLLPEIVPFIGVIDDSFALIVAYWYNEIRRKK